MKSKHLRKLEANIAIFISNINEKLVQAEILMIAILSE